MHKSNSEVWLKLQSANLAKTIKPYGTEFGISLYQRTKCRDIQSHLKPFLK
jgi:hypothetical protein